MIETKEGKTTLKGNKLELMTDLAIIVRGLKEAFMEDGEETEESVKQQIDGAVKTGLMSHMSHEEFENLKKEKTREIVKTLFDDLLGGLFDEDKGE